MKRTNLACHTALSLFALLGVFWPGAALAQSNHPAAVQPMQLSAFGGVTGAYTGLAGGKNLSVTAGVDLALPPVVRRFRPGLEFRGTFPLDKGEIDSQRSVLGGARVDFLLGRPFHPYADVLAGRGQMNYHNGYFYRNFEYILTTTWVYSFGAGVDLPLSPHFLVKLDGQMQHWGNHPHRQRQHLGQSRHCRRGLCL